MSKKNKKCIILSRHYSKHLLNVNFYLNMKPSGTFEMCLKSFAKAHDLFIPSTFLRHSMCQEVCKDLETTGS